MKTSGLDSNVAGMLCYFCSFVTGGIFLMIERQDKEVRFHAWQSIILGLSVIIIQVGLGILGIVLGSIAGVLGAIPALLGPFVFVLYIIFWILCMVKAYQGEHYLIPILGEIAEKQVNNQ